jgi:hypothetical protein
MERIQRVELDVIYPGIHESDVNPNSDNETYHGKDMRFSPDTPLDGTKSRSPAVSWASASTWIEL